MCGVCFACERSARLLQTACKLLTHLEMKVSAMIFANLQFYHCFFGCAENCLVERDSIFKIIERFGQLKYVQVATLLRRLVVVGA